MKNSGRWFDITIRPVTDPRFDDVYDGYGDYLAEVERELRWFSLRVYADVVISILGGWTIAYWIYLATWPEFGGGAGRILDGAALVIVGFFGFVFFSSLLSDVALALRYRRMLAATIFVVFVAGVALPMRERGRIEAAASALHMKSEENFRRSRDQADRKWVEDIYAAGAHGPLGTDPPMLIVEDDGTSVTVRNITDRTIHCVYIVRYLPSGGGGIILRPGGEDCSILRPGDSVTYTVEKISSAYEHGPLEFRIGEPHDPEPTWWSDNALQSTNYIHDIVR